MGANFTGSASENCISVLPTAYALNEYQMEAERIASGGPN